MDNENENEYDNEDAEECENEYEVEAIVGHRVVLDTGAIEVLVWWAGYCLCDATWEPLENVDGCEKFMRYVASDDGDWAGARNNHLDP